MTRKMVFSAVAALMAAVASPGLSGDFEGAYVGVSDNAGLIAPIGLDFEIAAFAGYNTVFDNGLVLGGQVDIVYNRLSLWIGPAMTGVVGARAGFLVSDTLLLYGRTGIGYTNGGAGSALWDVGLGAETFLTETLSLRTEFDYVDPFAAGMASQYNAKVGIAYHF